MNDLVVVLALVTAGLNLAAGIVGGWAWYRFAPSRLFWVLLRGAQGAAVLVALLAGGLAAAGRSSSDGLFYLYALVPVAVGLIAEQLRLTAAETVLAARGLARAQEVAGLPEAEQRGIVRAVVRREVGVMALSALVVCFLELRAAGTAHGL